MRENKSLNIREMIELSCNKYKSNVAFYTKEGKEYKMITYEQLGNDINALGTSLMNLGLKDKKIALIGKNRYEWCLAYLATVCGLGTIVPLDSKSTGKDIKNSLEQADIHNIIYSSEFESIVKDVGSGIIDNYISMDEDLSKLIRKGNEIVKNGGRQYIDTRINNYETSVLLFTSGTTSASKIVMLSHSSIMHVVNSVDGFAKIYPSDRFFSVLPLHHTLECTCGFLTPLSKGASIISCDNLKYVTKDMKETHPTVMIAVPRILEMFDSRISKELQKQKKIESAKFVSKVTNITDKMGFKVKRSAFHAIHDSFGGDLRVFVVGGAAMDPSISSRLRGYGFDVLQGYGLTECSPLVSVNKENNFTDDSVGLPIMGTDVKIVNADRDGVGEIIVRGPQVMNGYYNNVDATNKSLKRDGYFYTGDLGYIDRKGFIKIAGRTKNMILTSNGENIYPEEIEGLIKKNDAIKETLVGTKDVNGKQMLTATVVFEDEVIRRIKEHPEYKDVIMEMVTNYISDLNKDLVSYKRIQKIDFREEEFEKTSSLKIKR